MPRENKLLVIGIDEYVCRSHPRLNNAVADAKRFGQILANKYGFVHAQEPLLNQEATFKNIISALTSLTAGLGEEDNVLIFYAGHGIYNRMTDIAYWIPSNANLEPSEYVPHSTIIDHIKGMRCRHVLLISDSCFSGTFEKISRSAGDLLTPEQLSMFNSRWILASGGIAAVPDGKPGEGSYFANALCEILEKNTAPVLSANYVFQTVIWKVSASGRQEPCAWEIKCPQHDGGQMVFRLWKGATLVETAAQTPVLMLPLPTFPTLEYYIPRKVIDIEQQPDEVTYFFQSEKGRSHLVDLVQREKRIVVLGSAGSGKSIELQKLIETLGQRNSILIPGFKRFNTYTEQPIEALMPKGFKDIDPARALVLLDGLDEVPPQHFQTALRRIQQFTDDYQDATIVITCRSNFYELPQSGFSGTLSGFRVFMLTDLSPQDIVQALTKHYGKDGELFLRQVMQHNLRDLVTKPFFLSILIKRFLQYGHLSGKRIDIMEEALLTFQAANREHFNTTIRQMPQQEVITTLSRLAFVMEMIGRNYLTDEEMRQVMGSQPTVDDCHYLPAFSRDPDTAHWMFAHNNLQEYLVARELLSKSAERILELVTTDKTGEPKVKATWVNTLSFLVSIAESELNRHLLEWITRNDQEILIRFEPERISAEQRKQLFIDIFNFYSDKGLWLASNKFSDAELARFGQSEETLEFLLEAIENDTSTIMRKMNAVRVLDNFTLKDYPSADARTRTVLLSLLKNPALSYNDTYRIMAAFASLGLVDELTAATIVARYRRSKNQYIRAGLYLLLHHSRVLDQYVSVFIEGLAINRIVDAEDERGDVTLMDESIHLKEGLQKFTTPAALKELLTAFGDERYQGYFYFADMREVIKQIILNTVVAYDKELSILPLVADTYLSMLRHHSKQQAASVRSFFDKTRTQWEAFLYIWKQSLDHFEIRDAIIELTSDVTIAAFIRAFQLGTMNEADILQLHQIIFWNDINGHDSMRWLAELEQAAKAKGIPLDRPQLRDWAGRRKRQAQEAFDLLFDKAAMLREIERILAAEGKTIITRDEWFQVRSKNFEWEGSNYVTSATDLIEDSLRKNGQTTLSVIENRVNDPMFTFYQARNIFQDLTGHSKADIVVSESQKTWIAAWGKERGRPGEILWFFLNHFSLELPLDKLLDFTNYYHFGENSDIRLEGYLEALHRFVEPEKVRERTLQNLASGITDDVIWTSHAAYALRHRITSAYPGILERLTKAERSEYKYDEVLAFWYEVTTDHQRLARFIREVGSDDLRWRAINLLQKSAADNAFLVSYLTAWMSDETKEVNDRFYAANHLIALDDIRGFTFIATEFLKAPSPAIEFRHKFYNIPALKNEAAVDLLMQMLFYGKQPEYKKDHFDDLETLVLDALYQIGTQSTENFKKVRTAILSFMKKYKNDLPNLQFLEYRIRSMEEQLNLQYTKNYSISEAIREYHNLHA